MNNISPNENLFVTLNENKKMSYAEYGDPHGKPIFFFHGLCGSRLEASHFHHIASLNHYRVISIDRPGMGHSSLDKQRTILSLANDIESFANYLEIDKFSLIGHSGGAPYVAACVYAIPQRLHGAAIVSGMAPLEKPEAKVGMSRGQQFIHRAIIAMPFLTKLMMKLTCIMLKNPNSVMKQMIKQLPEVDQKIFSDPDTCKIIINATMEAFRNGIAGPAQDMKLLFHPWGFELENISFPLIIWQGTLDTQAPVSHAKIYANLVPHAKLMLVENEGHHSLIRHHAEAILKSVC